MLKTLDAITSTSGSCAQRCYHLLSLVRKSSGTWDGPEKCLLIYIRILSVREQEKPGTQYVLITHLTISIEAELLFNQNASVAQCISCPQAMARILESNCSFGPLCGSWCVDPFHKKPLNQWELPVMN